MSSQTNFEQFVKDLSEVSQKSEWEILHLQAQTAAKMYRFATKDLEALDIAIRRNGQIKIYKTDKRVKITKKVRQLIVWAVYRTMQNTIFPNPKVN